ncbi:MAG: type IV pilus secretin PilQ [Nitrospirota bacterium]|nr:type IV pilus secretin PilQ [Nitrospirota bacterium]
MNVQTPLSSITSRGDSRRGVSRAAGKLGCWLIVLALGSMLLVSGCGRKKPPVEELPKALTIQSITPRVADSRMEIVIEGSESILQYTSFQLTEPLRLVVDITDADLGTLRDKIVVQKGPVIDITPSQIDNIARLEIVLSQPVDSKVFHSLGKLMIELGKPVETTKATPEEVIASPSTEPESAPKPEVAAGPPAKVVKAVQATATKDGSTIVITGDGTMKPNTFMIEGKKLVIDIPSTKSRVRQKVIPVRKGGIDKVRVGQHGAPDQKVRVVVDLKKQMDYTVTPEGNTLIVAFVPAAAKAEEAPQERAAQAPEAAPAAVEKEVAQTAAVPQPGDAAPASVIAEAAPAKPEPSPIKPEAAPTQNVIGTPDILVGGKKYTGRRISLDLQDADLVNVLRLFGELANLNMILAPDVKGKVTVRLVNIPWDQAMEIILKMNGLGYVIEDSILRIASQAALAKEADEELRTKEAKKKVEDLITRLIPINYSTASGIEATIKKSLSARGETVVDGRTNTLIVKDISRNMEDIVELIKRLDRPTPQIMIEARIVEASLNFNRTIGVQWGGGFNASAATGNPTGLSFPNSVGVTGGPTMGQTPSGSGNYFVNIPAPAGAGTGGGAVGISFGSLSKALNLDLVLSAMESTGEGKVISTPRVSALDNKEAKIEQGVSIPFATSQAGGATNVQFIDAKLSLIVTPHATPDNKIYLKIKAAKNAPDTSLLGASGQPSIRKNEAETEILLTDGETAVIGGILIVDRGQTISKIPFFGDLPLIGWLFKSKSTREEKRELLIFITPRVIKQEII